MINNINSHKSYSGADVQRMAQSMVQKELRDLLGKKSEKIATNQEWLKDIAAILAKQAIRETKHG